MPEMNRLLARKKSSSSLRRKQSEAGSLTPSSTTPSDQKQEATPYQDVRLALCLRPTAALWANPTSALQIQAKVFVEPYLIRSRRFLKIHCFAMIYLKKLASCYRIEMKLRLFKISLD